MANELLVFLHGLGQTPQSWQQQVQQLPADLAAVAPWLCGTRPGGRAHFGLDAAVDELSGVFLQHGAKRVYLCGHGLGTMVALHASLHDERIAGLVLSAPQLPPSRRAMRTQRRAVRLMPRRRLAERGIDKDTMLRMLDSVADADSDARPELHRVGVPALVLAGERDRAGLIGARYVAQTVPGARLEELDAGSEPPLDAPAAFNELLFDFVAELRR